MGRNERDLRVTSFCFFRVGEGSEIDYQGVARNTRQEMKAKNLKGCP
jgi:hypothetical protein